MTATPSMRLGAAAAAALVFITSGAVLVLEILSLRLIAPYVGLTLETSTAVIGTALAAIALGAWAGGVAADRWDASRLIGPVMLASGVLVLFVLPVVRFTGERYGGAETILTLGLPALAIFLPAALLSMVSPMVVKVRLASLEQTGSVVGQLSGIGTLGALVATFVTGFVLVATIPASSTLFIVAGVLLMLGVVTTVAVWRSQEALGPLSVAAVGAMLGSLALVSSPQPCDVETAYHCVRVTTEPAGSSGRVLHLDTLSHSYVDLEDPTYLHFRYINAIASAVDARWPGEEPLEAVHLGGGGATLPRWIEATRPGSRSTVMEIDQGVVDVTTGELGLVTGNGVEVRVQDARTGLARTHTESLDLVVGDAFSGLSVPWHLTTQETVAEVARVLKPGGLYALNVIDFPPLGFARAEIATVASVFDHVALATFPETLDKKLGANLIILASDEPLPVSAWREGVTESVPQWVVIDGRELTEFVGDGLVLTDDFAPVDRLLTPRG